MDRLDTPTPIPTPPQGRPAGALPRRLSLASAVDLGGGDGREGKGEISAEIIFQVFIIHFAEGAEWGIQPWRRRQVGEAGGAGAGEGPSLGPGPRDPKTEGWRTGTGAPQVAAGVSTTAHHSAVGRPSPSRPSPPSHVIPFHNYRRRDNFL